MAFTNGLRAFVAANPYRPKEPTCEINSVRSPSCEVAEDLSEFLGVQGPTWKVKLRAKTIIFLQDLRYLIRNLNWWRIHFLIKILYEWRRRIYCKHDYADKWLYYKLHQSKVGELRLPNGNFSRFKSHQKECTKCHRRTNNHLTYWYNDGESKE